MNDPTTEAFSVNASPPLRLSDFDYALPEELIARYPLKQRDTSRMLVVKRDGGKLYHASFSNLSDFLTEKDLLIVNNTKVLPSRLFGNRPGRKGKIEVFLLYPIEDTNAWTALGRPTKALKPGTMVEFPSVATTVEVLKVFPWGRYEVAVHLAPGETIESFMNTAGEMPIPPYLARKPEESDKETYQTMFAKVPGAQAAPTAGLHFTPPVIADLKSKGIRVEEITLSVSSGTFRTVHTEDITEHHMDPEYYTIPDSVADAVAETKARGGRVVAVGTTSAKTLESSALAHNSQVKGGADWSNLFIYPGFNFQVVDVLFTNFHLPKSTLLMLVSAFSSRELMLKAYEEAVQEQYRFFSYGDCMLIV